MTSPASFILVYSLLGLVLAIGSILLWFAVFRRGSETGRGLLPSSSLRVRKLVTAPLQYQGPLQMLTSIIKASWAMFSSTKTSIDYNNPLVERVSTPFPLSPINLPQYPEPAFHRQQRDTELYLRRLY